MVEGLTHVLVHMFVSWVEDAALFLVQVHQEAIFAHVLFLLCWRNKQQKYERKAPINPAEDLVLK